MTFKCESHNVPTPDRQNYTYVERYVMSVNFRVPTAIGYGSPPRVSTQVTNKKSRQQAGRSLIQLHYSAMSNNAANVCYCQYRTLIEEVDFGAKKR